MKIIGISGKIGVGKTTLTNKLMRMLPGTWVRLAFADALKREVAVKFGFDRKFCYTPEGKDTEVHIPRVGYLKVREIMQWYGVARREENPDYWIEAARKEIEALRRRGIDGVIIDDVRFENEARYVRANGDLLVRLEPYPGWKPSPGAEKHVSETALDLYQGWDLVMVPASSKSAEISIEHSAQMICDHLAQGERGRYVSSDLCGRYGR